MSLGRFVPRYFILFVALMNQIDSWISFSDFSLLVCRIVSDFFVLILYPVILLNSLISSSNVQIVFLGFLNYSIMSSANSKSFTYSFLIWIDLISFFFSLIAVTRPSKLCWIILVTAGTLVLFLILMGMLSGFHHFNLCCRLIIYGLYYVEVSFFYAHFLKCFNHKYVLHFFKVFFFLYLLRLLYGFVFQFVNMMYHNGIATVNVQMGEAGK